MSFKLTLIPNDNYYREAFQEILSLKKLKKWEPLIASLLIMSGFILLYIDNFSTFRLTILLLIGIGTFELIKFYFEKHKWIESQKKKQVIGQVIELEFNQSTLKHSGPFSKGETKWEGFKDINKTNHGIVLKLDSEISLYLPDDIFSSQDQIDYVLSMKVQEQW